MAKKVFSVITFVFTILMVIALALLTVEMIQEQNYLSSLPNTSGIDYLGMLFYPMFYCAAAVPGIATSAVCLKLSANKVMKIISGVMLVGFIGVFVVFGMAWIGLIKI